MDIANLLQGAMGATLIDGVSKKLGIDNKSARMAIAVGLPLLITALKKNADKPDGANGILGAVTGKHDGSLLDNLGGLFQNDDHQSDGNGILGHIFGGKQDNINEEVAKQSGLDKGKVAGIMALLAPVVMGMIGKKANQGGASADGLSGLIGGLLGGGSSNQASGGLGAVGSLLDSFLDDDDKETTNLDGLKDLGAGLLGSLFNK